LESSCPFCGTPLRDAPAPLAFAGLLLGLTLVGCGDRTMGEDEGAGSETESTVSASSEESGSSGGGSETTDGNLETAEASDYAGPEPTEESGPQPESSSEDTGTEDTGTEDTTTAESGSSDSTGTDTGETTAAPDPSGEGSDYGGAPPPDDPQEQL
jgi:hypothetical protein